MSDEAILQAHTAEWLGYFRSHGYPGAEPLAVGVEGAIYRLGDGTIAKVWGRRTEAELRPVQQFYADVHRVALPFDTPEIHRLETAEGRAVSYERELHGTPLEERISFEAPSVPEEVAEALVSVLDALATVPITDGMKQVAVLDETRPLWDGHTSFTSALAALLDRRVSRFGPMLRERVQSFDRKYDQLLKRLTDLEPVPLSVVHGDLYPGNVLVDASGSPTAVLDFGFLATGGDPRLDAAITAVTANMYGPHAHAIAAAMTARIDCPPEVLLIYRAAYCVATSNFLSPEGTDGHFPWAVAWLNDPEVEAALR